MLQPKLEFVGPPEATAELYDRDPVLWSEEQAWLLAEVAEGKRPAGLDWENIIEEIESVGRSQINAVQSLLLQALVHELKAVSWPNTLYVEGWLNESRLYQAQARQHYTPSMRQRINPLKLAMAAVEALPLTIDGTKPKDGIIMEYGGWALQQLQNWFADPDLNVISLNDAKPAVSDGDLFQPEPPEAGR